MSLPQPLEDLGRRLEQIWRERAVLVKAMSFALVGLVNLVVDFSIFSIAYFHLKLPIITSNVIAWCIAVTGSYVMNSLTTFAKESGRQLRLKDYATFALSQVGGLITSTTTVFIASYFVPVLAAKGLAIIVGFMVNFSLSHFIVFRGRENTTDH